MEYKEMEYKSTKFGAVKEVLLDGKYKNYHFVIMNYGSHPCCYVEIPSKHKFYGKDYSSDGVEDFISCHGGLTFSSNHLQDIINDSWIIGWDYAHFGDYVCYDYNFPSFVEPLHKWTTMELFEDVKNVIEQLIEMEDKND